MGVIVNKKLCEKVVEVRRASDDICCFLRECAEVDLWVCSAKKIGRSQSSYDEMKGEWDMHNASDLVM